MLRLQEVDLVFSIFFSIYFLFILFLEYRIRVSNNMTQSHISYLRIQ